MPGWVNLLIFLGCLPWLIVVLVTRKTMAVRLPVCDRHRNHWLVRKLFIWLGLVFWIVAGLGLAVLDRHLDNAVVYPAATVLAGGILMWLVAGLILANGGVRAGEITNDWIDLVGVDRSFADAWKETHPDPEPRRRRRRPARRRSEIDEDEGW
jgi:hypothetical protein